MSAPAALLARAAVLLLAALAVLLGGAPPAAAHALLQSTSPVDGQTVEQAPAEVTLQFAEPVTASLGAIRVYDDTGTPLPTGEPVPVDGDRSRLAVTLPGELPTGTYVTTWAVTSADSHPVEGAFVFNVQSETADQGVVARVFAQSRSGDAALGLTASVVRAVVYAGTLLAAGGMVFLLRVAGRDPVRGALARVVGVAAAVAVVATLLGIAVQGALLSGLGPAALAAPQVLAAVSRTSFGLSAFVRVAGLVLLGVALARRWDPPAAAGGVVALASFTLTGHPATTDPRWLVVAANLAHTLAGATWFGGLVLLLIALRRGSGDPAARARLILRFSALAGGALLGVAAAGLALGWAQVRAPRALDTTYGWTLIVKVAVVGAVVALAAYNRRRLVPALRGGDEDTVGNMRRTVRLEVLGLVVVLAVTGFLTTLRPARSEAGIGEPFSQYVALGEDHQINLTVDPNVAGTNQVHIYLLGADGRPADVTDDITVRFSMPANGIAPIERTPSLAGPGHWLVTGPELSIPGAWLVEVSARVSEFDLLTAEVPVTVNA
jgi:copper transport protein